MPADRLLTTLLRVYQEAPDPEQTNKILSTTASLLTTLSNPLNVTLLTSQLLTAPAIWQQVHELDVCLRIVGIFNTAAITVHQHAIQSQNIYEPRQLHGGGISCDDWARAVVKGADDRSPRWKHLLVIGGVLLGMESQSRKGLSKGLRTTLERAMVTAANLALENPSRDGVLGADSIVLAINHTFPLLSDAARKGLNYDALVMIMVRAIASMGGYQEAYFLEAINTDVKQAHGSIFDWSSKSPSFLELQKLATKPLVSSMGPLARLIGHAIENMREPLKVVQIRQYLLTFTSKLLTAWRRNKLSEIDPLEEAAFLTPETLRITLPVLWQVLKSCMFAVVVILRAIIGRSLIDPVLSRKTIAPTTASETLLALENIHFISSRLGSNAFSAYTFVYLGSIDILSRYPLESKYFLNKILPPQIGHIPAHPLQRNLDLFYLNTSEHFTLVLSPLDSESLIIAAASPYLNPSANRPILELFEAAHSAMLAVLAAPQNAELTAKVLPFYVDSLFNSFPTNLSPRQFRFAFKALIQITTPPSPLSGSQPLLSETLLELLRHRALNAPRLPLPISLSIKSDADVRLQESKSQLSEQAVLLLALLDTLSSLPRHTLEEWLPLAADLLNVIEDANMREDCKARFWEVLESGEMDIERSAVCVSWWTTRGGKESVLFGRHVIDSGPYMSGGLGEVNRSRL